MNKHGTFLSILAAAMVMSLAVPAGAWAGGRHDNGGREYGYQQQGRSGGHYTKGKAGGHYNNHNKYTYNSYYSNNYSGGGHYKGGGYSYPYRYGYNNYCYKKQHHHNNNNNDNDELWIGLLGGGIVGYTLSNINWGY